MRINLSTRSREQGTVLVVSLIIAAVLGMGLASYLALIGSQHSSVARSQCWNSALTLAEAGIEEALAQMNSTSDFSNNGWGTSANGAFGPVTRNLEGGSYSVVVLTNPSPTIYSTGYVRVPITGDIVSRVVKVTAQKLPLINVAFAAVYDIDMNGNGMASDSFNSHDDALSTDGHYDSSKTSTNGNIASVYGVVDIGNHTINGSLYLGPTASYDSSVGQILGSIYNDYNVEFPDVTLPTATWTPATTVPDTTVRSGWMFTNLI